MEKKYSISVEPSADRRLASHIGFLARVSINAATRLYDEYKEALEFLESNPEFCPVYTPQTPIDAELRYKLFSNRYRIVFEIIKDFIYIYDIQDCRQDSDKNML